MEGKKPIQYRPVESNGKTYMYPVLTVKMQSFAEQLIPNKFNLTEAIKESSYEVSEKSRSKLASRLWARDDIREWLAVRLQEISDSLDEDQRLDKQEMRALQELFRVGYSNITDVVQWDESGKVKVLSSEEIPDEVKTAIKKIKSTTRTTENADGDVTETVTLEIELHDKLKAIELIQRIAGDYYKTNKDDEGDSKKGYIVIGTHARIENDE